MAEEHAQAKLHAEELQPAEECESASRRRFLMGALAGSAAGLAVAAGTGVAVWQISDAEAQAGVKAAQSEAELARTAADAALSAADAESRAAIEAVYAEAHAAIQASDAAAQAAIQAANADAETRVQAAQSDAQARLESAKAENVRLQGLVALYEDLESAGLDDTIQVGMMAIALPLGGVALGAKALRGGVARAEDALTVLLEALPSAEQSILWLEDRISALALAAQNLESALGQALDRAASNRIVEKLGDFAGIVLDNLPFGLGQKIHGVFGGLVGLVTGVDELLEGINAHLLEPLHENWFATEEGEGMRTTLVQPLVEDLLDPLEVHLDELGLLAETWEEKLTAPTQEALDERARIRSAIASYRREQGLD